MAEGSKGPGSTESGRFVSLGAKLGLAVVLVVTCATAFVFVRFSERERESLVAAKRTAADMVADFFAASLGAPLDFGDNDGVEAEIQNLRQNRDITFAAVWLAGERAPLSVLRAGSEPPASVSEPGAPRTTVYEDRIETVRSVLGGERGKVGSAVVVFSLSAENAAWRVNRMRLFWSCVALALGTMGLLLAITRRQVVLPIDGLLAATRRLEKGERGAAIPVVANDEIGRLARAFESMQSAVVDREQRLERAHRRLRELFDHMRQAIVVFGADGRVEATESRKATQIFGEDVAGRAIRDVLYGRAGDWDAELRAFDEWLKLAFEVPAEHFTDVESLAPREVTIGEPSIERVLSLEFRPIDEAGGVRRIMLLATDETEKTHLKRDVIEQAERHAAQMAAMRRLLGGGGQQFVLFLETARGRLARIESHLLEPPTEGRLRDVFQDVHTLKGEARAFELGELAALASGIEELLGELSPRLAAGGTPSVAEMRELSAGIVTARELVAGAEQLFIEVSPTGRAVLDQVTVRRSDLEKMCELAKSKGGPLTELAERLTARSLGEVAVPFADRAPSWAAGVGKVVVVQIDGREVLVPAKLSRVLGGVLSHLVRNAIAHGIEEPEVRAKHGKPASGLIIVRGDATSDPLSPSITVEDDGRGVGDNELLSGAIETARPLAPIPRASFRPASAEDRNDLSGRGVGLAAVVRDLTEAGYALHVSRRDGGGTRFGLVPQTLVRGGDA